MFKPTVCGLLLLIAMAVPSTSKGAAVSFLGTITSGMGVLGTVPPTFDFAITLNFTDLGGGFATIDSGLFSSTPGNINISGGNILLIENGVNDQGLLSISTSTPAGSIDVTFMGNGILNNQVNAANLIALVNASAPATISANFGAQGNYTGSVTSAVTAVPEPNASAPLLGGVLLGVYRRWRRKA